MKTPLDPAIAVSEFVVALTQGIPRWSNEHAAAVKRVDSLRADRDRWVRTGTTLHRPIR